MDAIEWIYLTDGHHLIDSAPPRPPLPGDHPPPRPPPPETDDEDEMFMHAPQGDQPIMVDPLRSFMKTNFP